MLSREEKKKEIEKMIIKAESLSERERDRILGIMDGMILSRNIKETSNHGKAAS